MQHQWQVQWQQGLPELRCRDGLRGGQVQCNDESIHAGEHVRERQVYGAGGDFMRALRV